MLDAKPNKDRFQEVSSIKDDNIDQGAPDFAARSTLIFLIL